MLKDICSFLSTNPIDIHFLIVVGLREGVPTEVHLEEPISLLDRLLAKPTRIEEQLHLQDSSLVTKDVDSIAGLFRVMRSYLRRFSSCIDSGKECQAIPFQSGSERFLFSYEFSRHRSDAAHLDIHDVASRRIASIYVADGQLYDSFVMLPSTPFAVTRNVLGQYVPSHSEYLDSNARPIGDVKPGMVMLANFRTCQQSKLSFDYFDEKVRLSSLILSIQ